MAPQLRSLPGRSTVVGDQQTAGSMRAIAHPGRRQAAMRCRPQASTAVAGVRTATSPREAVEMFYAAQNAGDTEQIAALMAEDVEYHDMVYADPFRGRHEVEAYFRKVKEAVPDYVKFVAEDIVSDDRAAGVRWHVEIDGHEFPFSRGVSFYEFDSGGKMLKARDVVEGAVKPGSSTLRAIGVLAPLMRKLGPRASSAYLPTFAAWSFYAGYVALVLFSNAVPGVPAYQVSWPELRTTLHESANLFYINVFMDRLGIAPVPSIPEHPVDEALFNVTIAWSLMLGPLMLLDPRASHIRTRTRWLLWSGTLFLTNIFFIPFMARRAAPAQSNSRRWPSPLPAASRAAGAVAAAVGVFSIYWALFARPEYGALAERWEFAVQTTKSSRIAFAFVLDLVLYSVFQPILMPKGAGALRFVPFAGLAAWLIGGATDSDAADDGTA